MGCRCKPFRRWKLKLAASGAVAFAHEHDDLTVKAMGVVLADVVLGTRLLAGLITVTSKHPPNARKLKALRRRLDKV